MTAPPPQLSDQILRYVSGARWFAGKGRRAQIDAVTSLPWITDTAAFATPGAGPAVRMDVVEIGYPDDGDEPEFYQLALSFRSAPHGDLHHAEVARFDDPDLGSVVAYDAARDPEACRIILGALLDQQHFRNPDARLGCHLSSAEGLSTDLEPRVFTGQQSNTSVMFGDVAILKLFRRLELGRNLDIEVHEALNAAQVHDVAGLFGWIDASWERQGQTLAADLGMVVEMLAGAVDGWGLALEELQADSDFGPQAYALGHALRETHAALRAAFPTREVAGAETAAVMGARLTRAADHAPALAPYVAGLRVCFDALAAESLPAQRVHGDFHLGQTLHTPDGWKIIDFEGEPAKSMAERLAPDSVWRDIAGMLRSFDYAAASVPAPHSADWAGRARTEFLRGYAGGELSPVDAATLRAYEADKAIYEVVYEVRNRPDWVGIPLGAVASLAATSGDGDRSDPHHEGVSP